MARTANFQPGIDPALDRIFCAAIAGFVSNKDFHGPTSQGSPRAAVEFASEVVAIVTGEAIAEGRADLAEYPEREDT